MLRKISLTGWIFIALVTGAMLGEIYHSNHTDAEQRKHFADNISIFSDIFLRLIKMIIAPLVFSTLVVGIAKLGDFKVVGRVGLKTILYFQFATLLALTLGLVIVNVLRPGDHFHMAMPASDAVSGFKAGGGPSLKEFISHVIPKSVIEAMADNEILPIVIFSIFFGIALAAVGEIGKPIIKALDALAHVMFKVTNYVMYFAPFGVFGAICAVIAVQGIEVVRGYFYLIVCFYGGLIFFAIIILGIIATIARINFIKLLKHLQEPILLAFSTASSESAFPKMVEKLKKFGCSERIISFVLPLGYSFNLDGSIIYMTFATAFIAQTYGRVLSIEEQITMMLILLVTSKGMAGVPRASLVVIAALLPTFGLPESGLLLLLGIDQLLDMGRSATNVVGNGVATALVSKWEGELKE